MTFRIAIMTTLVMLSMILVTPSTALDISDDGNDVKHRNYNVTEDAVVMKSLFGDVVIPIPEDVKAEIKSRNNPDKRFEKLVTYGSEQGYSSRHRDLFSCMDEADVAISPLTDSYRSWEPFFKRNKFDDTVAVRYCCNMLDYANSIQYTMSEPCRNSIRLYERVMLTSEVRAVCRQYDYYGVECFLVRWMYWWIPVLALALIVIIFVIICCVMKSRRNKKYLKARQDDKNFRNSLVNGTAI